MTFKECEGYDIASTTTTYSSEAYYSIKKDNETVISGSTTMYNEFYVYHGVADELLNQESIQKSK